MRLKHYNAMWIGCRVPPAGTVTGEPPIDPCVANLSNGLIAYWDADSVPDTDEIGGRILDGSGVVSLDPGKIGKAWRFSAPYSYLTCPDDAPLRLLATSYTIRFWLYVPTETTQRTTIVSKGNGFADQGWYVTLDSDRVMALSHGSFGIHTAPNAVPYGEWVHCVFTYEVGTGDVRIWFNATLASSIGATMGAVPNYTGDLYVGWDFEVHVDPRFTGDLDELLISTYPWTQCEVDADYNSGAGRTYPFIPLTAPEVDGSGFIKLKEPNDDTWHNLKLINDGGAVAPFVDQTAESEGSRGYILMEADDATIHKVELYLDSGVYTYIVEQSASLEDADYASINLGYGTSARHTVTVINSGGIYELKVNQTPV